MNTKFDVGQRVTYPVVHTADGNITGIAVSKSGVTRYAIGPKWYTEDDLKLAAEEKPVTEPIKESEPVKLYCVKSYEPGEWLTKGKIYEVARGFDGNDYLKYNSWESQFMHFDWPTYQRNNPSIAPCLVPLVRRPAKVGEWVYIAEDYSGHHCKPGYIYRVNFKAENDGVYFKQDGTGYVKQSKYLVLDGYHGDPA